MRRPALAMVLRFAACVRSPLILPKQPRERVTHFHNVRVFDGKSNTLSPPLDVRVRDGRVTAISGLTHAPPSAAVAFVHVGTAQGVWKRGERQR